ncbi:MAG: thioredoxin family protein [Bacteroidetes bacterium]|nr:MAG: thioredoxin family protein [Bacteroidota bacterium]
MDWKQLTSVEDLDRAIIASENVTVVLFKHSTRCSISRMALKMFESAWDETYNDVEAYFLDLLQHRDVSNAIADRFNVRHESPQMLILQGGKATFHASHHSIDVNHIKNYL